MTPLRPTRYRGLLRRRPTQLPSIPARRSTSELLKQLLDERQQKMFADYGFFYLRGADRKFYALTADGWTFYPIDERSKRPVTHRAAGLNYEVYPRLDSLIAQILALRTAPELLVGISCGLGSPPETLLVHGELLATGELFRAEHYR